MPPPQPTPAVHSAIEDRNSGPATDNVAQRTAEQVNRNYEAFREILPTLLPEHLGRFALMRDGGVVGLFDTAMEAYTAGKMQFGLGNFSMQKIIDRPVDLGYFSHAMHQI
jgi:hypothetical protein